MNEIRLIVMDLDGTLLDPKGNVSPANRQALALAREQGIVTAACSGRYCENISMILLDAGVTGPVVGANGAEMTESPFGPYGWRHTIAPGPAGQVRDALEEMNTGFFVFAAERVVTSSPTAVHYTEVAMGDRITARSGIRFTHGPEAVQEAIERGVFKYYVADNGDLEETRIVLERIPGITVTRSTPWNLEVMAQDVDKGRAVRELAERLGIPVENTMAFGDQENDLPMLRAAGAGVAMGNAEEAVKKLVPYTALSNGEDGIARFLFDHGIVKGAIG